MCAGCALRCCHATSGPEVFRLPAEQPGVHLPGDRAGGGRGGEAVRATGPVAAVVPRVRADDPGWRVPRAGLLSMPLSRRNPSPFQRVLLVALLLVAIAVACVLVGFLGLLVVQWLEALGLVDR
jgi:hypothetical protein